MIGTVLSGRYEITGEIGRGGMGVVFRARDPLLNRDVAIKMISPGALGKKAEARIRREARLVAGLDHPSVVPIHDLGKHDGSLYLVMPLVKGDTLATRIQRRDLDPLEVVEIGIQLARALDHSHAKGIRHRDVKPSNVLVSQDGGMRARLMDFGLAQFDDEGDQLTGSHNLPGTAGYLSPEQVAEAGADLDGRSDLYSLGVVLYECLLGEPPFTGTLFSILYRISHEIPRSLRERGLDVDPELETLILRCLAKHPDERPDTGEELARLLTACRDRLREDHASAGGSDAAGTAPDRPAVVRTYADGPLVGRREELAQLQERLAAALEGECQLVALGGGAGIGKRRLVGELEGLVRAKRLTLLRGRFVDWESAFPFQGLSDLIVDFFRRRSSTDASTPAVDLTDLAPDLMAAFPTLLEVPELRGSPQALPSRAAPGAAAAPPKEPTFIFELLARTLLRLSGGGPMVLVLENLQAARSALDAVRYLVGRLGPTPTLVLATYRTSDLYRGHPLERFLDGFAADPRFLRLELPPLSPTEIRRLIEVQMGTAALEVEMVERLHETTEGNPLFCRELLKILLETGGIERASSGRFTLSGDARLGTDVLPANIQQAEERRIERLGDEQHRLLSVASVLGKNFATRDLEELLEAAGGRDPDTDDRLDELLASGL
ncbi:MAG: protein kinase, partial [Acidobacteriota bacterium]